MARSPNSKSPSGKNVDLELEKALEFDLSEGLNSPGDMDFSLSMEDLEKQISQAADELARESRGTTPPPARHEPVAAKRAAPTAKAAAKPAETRKPETARPQETLRPVEEPITGSAPFQPANDDRQKDFRALQQALARKPSGAVNWAVALLPLVWIGGGLALTHILSAPDIWDIRSFRDLMPTHSICRYFPSQAQLQSVQL